jgi:NAD(P)-dependent dehydrogenase (short-subunit alcohol dehydrogenase family)
MIQRAHIVTGGARGIGRAIAQYLADQGDAIVLVDQGVLVDGSVPSDSVVTAAAAELRSQGGAATGLAVDVTDADAVRRAVAHTIDEYGRLDGVVNAAGVLRLGNSVTMTDEDWRLTLEVNVSGTMNMCRAAIAHWLASDCGGAIVNFTSTAGIEGIPHMLAYSASKSAVLSMTKALANDVASRGIRVNALAPNADTRMAVRGMGELSLKEREATGHWPQLSQDGLKPQDVATLCAFLLSPAATSITGRVLTNMGRRYGLLAEPSEEIVVHAPEFVDAEEANRYFAATFAAAAPKPPRFRADDVREASDQFGRERCLPSDRQ